MKTRLLVTTSLFLFACGDNLSSVPEPVCGDGVVEGQEACDDGNDVDSDGCSSSCTLAVCGDGKLDFNEGCDDGNTSNADGCDSNCVQTFCGNGVKSGDEQCDDNNTISGDGCDNNCKITACGNGVMTTGETCDDGNAVEGDGCDSNCTTSACGNGIVANNEQCDDGNTATADGCSGSCRTEASEIEPNEDGSVSTGGTGIVGNDFAIAAADTNGAFTGSKTILAKIDPAGDEDVFKLTNTGTVPVRLKLDTWNLAMNFGIGVSCGTASIDTGINVRNAAGTVLVSNNDRASGDRCAGLVTGLLPGDTVYAHVTELGDNAAIASYALDVQFIPVVCGDGDVGPGEQCDDMNTAVGDGCSATCQIEGGVSEIEPNEDGTPSTGGNGIAGNDFGSANATANGVISASTTYIASLTPAGDEDVFAFTNAGTTGTVVQLDVWGLGSGFGIGVPCGTAIDTGMHVRNAAGLSLVFNDDRSGNTDRCSTITLNLFPGETRFAHVSEYDDDDVVTQYALQVKYTPVVCGDSTVGFTETCDDGNTTAGDGCSATCQVEPVCANSSVEPPEQCDDGNMTAGDGCSATCQLENAMTEIEPNEDGSVSTGGFGIVGNDFGTAAPDANGAITTSKRVLAQINPAGDEDVFALHNPGSTYVTVKLDVWNVALTYGIGVSCGSAIDTGLQVKTAAGSVIASNDDRSTTDNCSALTVSLAPGATVYAQVVEYGDNATIAQYVLDIVFTPVVCGDSAVGGGEQCDDGNTMNGDGCSSTCQVEGTVTEVEPNNTTADATGNAVQVSADTLISGAISPAGDVDRFRLTLATATTVRFETFTALNDCAAGTTMDLRLFNSAGTVITTDTANAGIASCAAIVIHLAAGTYFVQAEERGNNATIAQYFLQIALQDDRGMETEPNETQAAASTNLLTFNESFVFGDHSMGADVDVYSITVPPGGKIRAEIVEGDRTVETCESNGVNSRLTLYDDNFVQLVDDDDDGRGLCSLIAGTGTTPLDAAAKNASATAKTYYVQVRASATASPLGGQFIYRLQLTIR